ncbi:MAG: DUF1572 domain-containing protein [Acidobacteria bacterium]|nr:DUF1572 domain-containing protein [Acidobacteriota bacterium]
MTHSVLELARTEFRSIRRLAERAIAQVDDAGLHATLDADGNSIAMLMRHMAGNMRSRWTDFLTTDGEKPDRLRDQEFEPTTLSRDALMAEWNAGWALVFAALDPLTDHDLFRIVTIRTEPLTVCQAIYRQVSHYSGHAYQILLLARHLKGADWETLSVPKGQSEQYNAQMIARLKARG